MNERSKELLSAYLDDALAEPQLHELANEWTSDGEMAAVATRYQAIGELLRAQTHAGGSANVSFATPALSARVRQALDSSVGDVAQSAPSDEIARARRLGMLKSRYLRPVAGLALAAAIALMAIGAFRVWTTQQHIPPVAVAASGNAAGTSAEPRWSAAQPAVERRLDQYLVNHAAVSGGARAALPYARVVGYQIKAPAER
jgi:sigma-E factor negative regulatory protein RseA